ncbi:MAG: hypothetical protein GY941_28520 [Planctomycetes bacterium]|nr:hypothetical protein [Planctomycetota bacterium]
MTTMAAIIYREFYDVPRVFLVNYKGDFILFESLFNDDSDDYSSDYIVYLMPKLSEEELKGSWENISLRADRKIGSVPVKDIQFDETKRKEIDAAILDKI